ncbi:MAG: RsmE family RNA methyltransferase [Edaphobacter sp.]
MTRRRWIADTWTPTTAALTGDQAAHLARVLRAEPGQVFDVVAGGFLHRAEIVSVSEDEVTFTLHEELESDTALPLHLLLAVFKFDHMEWAIEKATELGVSQITPILARRTEKHLAQAAAKRAERWRRIALEASKQSRRTTIPEINDPIPLKLALDREQSPTRILLSETEQATTLSAALTAPDRPTGYESVALSIGPEGGWTPEEMSLFTEHCWAPVTLGPRILRAETAAIAAIAITSSYLA